MSRDLGLSWVILDGCAPFGGKMRKMLPVPHFIRNPFRSVFTSWLVELLGVLDLQWLE